MAISRKISCLIVLSVILLCAAALPPVYGQSMVPRDQVYACDVTNESIQVFDGASGSLVTTITSVGAHPHVIIVSPDGSMAYVATTDPGTGASAIVMVDIASNTVVKKVTIPGAISDIAITYDGRTLYALAYDTVISVDLPDGKLSNAVALRQSYTRLAVGPDRSHLFICAQAFGMMNLDVSGDGVIDFLGGWHGSDIAPTIDGSRVYLCDSANSTIIVTDTQIGRDATKILIPGYGQPLRMLISPDGSRAYVFTDGHKVLGINTQSNAIVSTWDLGDRQPKDMAIAQDGKHLYVSCDDTLNHRGTIAVIDTSGSDVGDLLTNAGIGSIAVRQVMVPAEPTPTATPIATPASTPISGSATPGPQSSASPTAVPSPSESGKSTGICPLLPISFGALILLGLAGRKVQR